MELTINLFAHQFPNGEWALGWIIKDDNASDLQMPNLQEDNRLSDNPSLGEGNGEPESKAEEEDSISDFTDLSNL